MKRLCRLAVRLYPSWWRQRYASEFEALLDEMKPGWREILDVIQGALTMQIQSLGTIPVVCALAGAIVGGIIAMRTPEVFASSSTILLKRDVANASPGTPQELHVSLDKALGVANGKKEATLVTMRKWDSAQTTLTLTYLDRNAGQAQRVAEQLTAAIATSNREGIISTKVLSAPDLPTSPIKPDYPMNVASGGGVGLVAGCVVLLLGWRRPPARVK
jgi:hypothetical protein